MSRRNADLDKCLLRFYREEDRQQIQRDIKKADALFDANPAPAPDFAAIDTIKHHLAAKLQKTSRPRHVWRMAFAAAALLVVAVLVGIIFQTITPIEHPAVAGQIWEDQNAMGYDTSVAALADEIDDIERTLNQLKLGEATEDTDLEFTDFEMELIETNGDFWKG